jgi:hypothetical protein
MAPQKMQPTETRQRVARKSGSRQLYASSVEMVVMLLLVAGFPSGTVAQVLSSSLFENLKVRFAIFIHQPKPPKMAFEKKNATYPSFECDTDRDTHTSPHVCVCLFVCLHMLVT